MTMPLAYGFCVGPSGKYERVAAPALQKILPGAIVYERRGQRSIFEAYNSIIDEYLRESPHLHGLVLMHDDVELRSDPTTTILDQFEDGRVAIVGAIGGREPRSVRWSRARERYGHAPDGSYGENHLSDGPRDVDIVDGLILALSPWAVRNLRFDASRFTGFHGYDADICMQARSQGMIVRVADFDLFHHSKGGFGDVRSHRRADDAFRRKWDIPFDNALYRFQRRLRNREY